MKGNTISFSFNKYICDRYNNTEYINKYIWISEFMSKWLKRTMNFDGKRTNNYQQNTTQNRMLWKSNQFLFHFDWDYDKRNKSVVILRHRYSVTVNKFMMSTVKLSISPLGPVGSVAPLLAATLCWHIAWRYRFKGTKVLEMNNRNIK